MSILIFDSIGGERSGGRDGSGVDLAALGERLAQSLFDLTRLSSGLFVKRVEYVASGERRLEPRFKYTNLRSDSHEFEFGSVASGL